MPEPLAPIRLPFVVQTVGGGAAAPAQERSWGHRLGLWWTDAEEGGPGVVVTGLLKGAASAGGLAVGDVILAIEGQPVETLGDLTRHLDEFGAGTFQLAV